MEYELPEAQYIPTANIEVPLLSILGENKAGDHRRVPRRLQLVECERQARIAALHIDRAWALTERHAGPSDDTLVWAELQGAMTAGIILSRMLRPTGVRPRRRCLGRNRRSVPPIAVRNCADCSPWRRSRRC